MATTFHWGIIGTGKIATHFADDIAITEGAQLHAVLSRSQERASTFGQHYRAPHAYNDLSSFVQCPGLDAVYIATPHTSHCRYTLECLAASVPVLCEKPFAMNSEEARSMVDAARRNDVFLMEALWTRFLPTTLQLLSLIESGRLGRILSVKADFGFPAKYDPEGRLFNPALGGGALLDIGIYPVFLALLLLGEPQTIKAMAQFAPTGVDVDTGVLLQYADGRMAHLHCSLLARTKTEAFIYGERGTVHIHSRWHEPTSMSFIGPEGRPENFHFDWKGKGYTYEMEAVMKAIQHGEKESVQWPLAQSLLLTATLDRIREEMGLSYAVPEV